MGVGISWSVEVYDSKKNRDRFSPLNLIAILFILLHKCIILFDHGKHTHTYLYKSGHSVHPKLPATSTMALFPWQQRISYVLRSTIENINIHNKCNDREYGESSKDVNKWDEYNPLDL